MDGLCGSTLESNLSRNLLLVASQSHIFQQETNHAFALPVGRLWVLPDLRKVTGEVEYLLAPSLFEHLLAGQPQPFILLFRLTGQSQFAIPIRFQRTGYQTVVGIDPLIAAFGQPRFICRWRRKTVPFWRRSGALPRELFGVSLSLF